MYFMIFIVFMILFYSNKTIGKEMFRYCIFRKQGFQLFRKTVISYGYSYEIRQHLLYHFLILCCVIYAGSLFHMKTEIILYLVFISFAMYPFIFLWIISHSYQEKNFADLTLFLQHFIALYKMNPKAYMVLKECRKLVNQEIGEVIDETLQKIEEEGNVQHAFDELIKKYPHFIVHNLFTLAGTIEQHGSLQYISGLDFIQDDIDDWVEDVYLWKQKQIQAKNRILVLCAFSTLIAYVAKNMLLKISFDIYGSLYQTSVFIFFLCILITLFMAHRILSYSWMEKEESICMD